MKTPGIILEALEPRIAPAGMPDSAFSAAVVGANLVTAGNGLSTSDAGGSRLAFVEQGQAIIYITDLNYNGQVDYDEVTGVAAGDGLSMVSFVDIHGDIVTNLKADGMLTDSDNNTSNGLDGKVLLNSKINKIEMRSLRMDEVGSESLLLARLARSDYSIYGSIFAGGGFGTLGGSGGLIVDSSGAATQATKFDGSDEELYSEATPFVGSIFAGSAASGQRFTFGVLNGSRFYNDLQDFTPSTGQAGADIIGIKSIENGLAASLSIGDLRAGDGGFGARGGNIQSVVISGDAGGYSLVAGNGGDGLIGGAGGAILGVSDLGSETSSIVIQTGSGGDGLQGAGGSGGALQLGTFNAGGSLRIVLGDGGSGFTNGGNGAGLATATFNIPEVDVTEAEQIVTQYTALGDVGTYRQIDFDQDGYGDLVFTTTNPGQIVVMFGDSGPEAFDTSRTLFLDSSDHPSELAVADFDNDGVLDIVVGSSSETSSGFGISLFRGDLDGSGNFDFLAPVYSSVPRPEGGYLHQSPIYAMAAGDFNDDGLMDVAVNVTFQYSESENDARSAIVFLLGEDDGTGSGTGHLVADNTYYLIGAEVYIAASFDEDPHLFDGDLDGTFLATDLVLKASAFSTTNSRFVLAGLRPGEEDGLFTLSMSGGVNYLPFADSIASTSVALLDGDGDGDVDAYFLDGTDLLVSADLTTVPVTVALTVDADSSLVGMVTADTAGTGSANSLIILDYLEGGIDSPIARAFSVSGLTVIAPVGAGSGYAAGGSFNNEIVAFAPYVSDTAVPAMVDYAIAVPSTGDYLDTYFSVDGANFSGETYSTIDRVYDIVAGDGGDGLTGIGGLGGSIGNGSLSLPVTPDALAVGSVNIIFPNSEAFSALSILVGGDGGSGFIRGGSGGNISGVTVQYVAGTETLTSEASVFGGNGGNSTGGIAGNGGSIQSVVFQTVEVIQAGDGGGGLRGGLGGSVTGRGNSTVPDNESTGVLVAGGDGGNGVLSGGAGGAVRTFLIEPLEIVNTTGGILWYLGGVGGSATAGIGGLGGSVVGNSPSVLNNHFAGELRIIGGDGGSGLAGGAGGFIDTFVNSPTTGLIPSVLTAIGGAGGDGVTGAGGAGGGIFDLTVTARGQEYLDDLSVLNDLTLNRLVAGNGGDSFGGTGGAGGTLSNVILTSVDAAAVAAAGKAGDGLAAGGAGGNVLASRLGVGTGTINPKILIVAGAGGDAHAYTATTQTALDLVSAFGGRLGIGGAGGSITDVSNGTSVAANFDLIAGNGGDTINHGSPIDTRVLVGRGGSISNVDVTGSIGNVAAGVAIKAYEDINAGETISDFIQSVILLSPGTALDDTVGNVGIIAGVAGRVAGDMPNSAGLNGSVTSVRASQGIMSMVAGSVDRIAAIQTISGIVAVNGIYGSDKATLGVVNYDGADTSPSLGGRLADGSGVGDGAIVGKVISADLVGRARVFIRG